MRNGDAVVWWSTDRIAAREVRGSNTALGILFQRFSSVYEEEFNGNSRLYLYARVTEWNQLRVVNDWARE